MQLNEEEIEEKYGANSLAPEMTDEMYKLVHQVFMYECASLFNRYAPIEIGFQVLQTRNWAKDI